MHFGGHCPLALEHTSLCTFVMAITGVCICTVCVHACVCVCSADGRSDGSKGNTLSKFSRLWHLSLWGSFAKLYQLFRSKRN